MHTAMRLSACSQQSWRSGHHLQQCGASQYKAQPSAQAAHRMARAARHAHELTCRAAPANWSPGNHAQNRSPICKLVLQMTLRMLCVEREVNALGRSRATGLTLGYRLRHRRFLSRHIEGHVAETPGTIFCCRACADPRRVSNAITTGYFVPSGIATSIEHIARAVEPKRAMSAPLIQCLR